MSWRGINPTCLTYAFKQIKNDAYVLGIHSPMEMHTEKIPYIDENVRRILKQKNLAEITLILRESVNMSEFIADLGISSNDLQIIRKLSSINSIRANISNNALKELENNERVLSIFLPIVATAEHNVKYIDVDIDKKFY